MMQSKGIKLVNQFGSELRIVADTSVTPDKLQNLIATHYNQTFQLQTVTPSIEDAFISLTHNDDKQ